MHTRDQVKLIKLPKLDSVICPCGVLEGLFQLYSPGSMDPPFLVKVGSTFQVMTDSKARKGLAMLNQVLGLPRSYYMFYYFQHSGATLAYKNVAH